MTSRWIAAATAVAVAALGLSAVQTFGFDARVRAYLLANPEILIEMDSALKTHEAERAAAAVNANAAANPGLLAVDRRDPSFGPANAKVTVIQMAFDSTAAQAAVGGAGGHGLDAGASRRALRIQGLADPRSAQNRTSGNTPHGPPWPRISRANTCRSIRRCWPSRP